LAFEQGGGSGEDGEADGDVDEEHPPPVEQAGEKAAEQDAHGHADR